MDNTGATAWSFKVTYINLLIIHWKQIHIQDTKHNFFFSFDKKFKAATMSQVLLEWFYLAVILTCLVCKYKIIYYTIYITNTGEWFLYNCWSWFVITIKTMYITRLKNSLVEQYLIQMHSKLIKVYNCPSKGPVV